MDEELRNGVTEAWSSTVVEDLIYVVSSLDQNTIDLVLNSLVSPLPAYLSYLKAPDQPKTATSPRDIFGITSGQECEFLIHLILYTGSVSLIRSLPKSVLVLCWRRLQELRASSDVKRLGKTDTHTLGNFLDRQAFSVKSSINTTTENSSEEEEEEEDSRRKKKDVSPPVDDDQIRDQLLNIALQFGVHEFIYHICTPTLTVAFTTVLGLTTSDHNLRIKNTDSQQKRDLLKMEKIKHAHQMIVDEIILLGTQQWLCLLPINTLSLICTCLKEQENQFHNEKSDQQKEFYQESQEKIILQYVSQHPVDVGKPLPEQQIQQHNEYEQQRQQHTQPLPPKLALKLHHQPKSRLQAQLTPQPQQISQQLKPPVQNAQQQSNDQQQLKHKLIEEILAICFGQEVAENSSPTTSVPIPITSSSRANAVSSVQNEAISGPNEEEVKSGGRLKRPISSTEGSSNQTTPSNDNEDGNDSGNDSESLSEQATTVKNSPENSSVPRPVKTGRGRPVLKKVALTPSDIVNMSVEEMCNNYTITVLQQLCKCQGLPQTGSKFKLAERLFSCRDGPAAKKRRTD